MTDNQPEMQHKLGFLDTPIVCPRKHTRTTAWIPYSRALHFLKYGPAHKYYELLHLLRPTLTDPDAYYPYIADDFPGFCYTKALDYAYTNKGQ